MLSLSQFTFPECEICFMMCLSFHHSPVTAPNKGNTNPVINLHKEKNICLIWWEYGIFYKYMQEMPHKTTLDKFNRVFQSKQIK